MKLIYSTTVFFWGGGIPQMQFAVFGIQFKTFQYLVCSFNNEGSKLPHFKLTVTLIFCRFVDIVTWLINWFCKSSWKNMPLQKSVYPQVHSRTWHSEFHSATAEELQWSEQLWTGFQPEEKRIGDVTIPGWRSAPFHHRDTKLAPFLKSACCSRAPGNLQADAQWPVFRGTHIACRYPVWWLQCCWAGYIFWQASANCPWRILTMITVWIMPVDFPMILQFIESCAHTPLCSCGQLHSPSSH